jgi:hypothetical protein
MKVVVKLEKGGKVVAQSELKMDNPDNADKRAGKAFKILRQQDIEVSLFDASLQIPAHGFRKPMTTFSIGSEVNDERTGHVGTGDFHICNKRRSIWHRDSVGVQHAAALPHSRSTARCSNGTCGF